MKRIASHPGLGYFTVSLLLAGLVGLAFSTPVEAAKGGVNLVIAGTVASPKSLAPGQGFTIRVTVQNNGGEPAAAFRVEAYRGQRSLRKGVDFKGLAPGARDTQSIALKYPGGISTLAAGPSAVPKRFCVDLVINKLNNKKAKVGSSKQVCVSAKTVAKSSKKPEKPSARLPEKTARKRPSSREDTPRARAALPAPVAPKGPIEIKIASLDILRDKFVLELANEDKERDLRSPLVEVWHVQAGERNRIDRGYLTIIRAGGTKLLRILVPKNAKATDYVELWVNKKLVDKKSLRGVLDEPLSHKGSDEGESEEYETALFPIIADPGHAPRPPTPSCSPTVYMWFDPVRPRNVYYDDEPFTVHYSVDCATWVSVGSTRFPTTAEELAAAEGGYFLDAGGGSGPGGLTGSRRIDTGYPAWLPNWEIHAGNRLNPSSPAASERAEWTIIQRPRLDASCSAYRACISEWGRGFLRLVGSNINNARLDREVEVFRAGVLDRRVFVLRLRLELETMASGVNVICAPCPDPRYATADACVPDIGILIYLNMDSPTGQPHDYALLHEVIHRAGFMYPYLPTTYTRSQIEDMTHQVTRIVMGSVASRDCTGL